uniref:Uncharacterized protein n=1 Tax=Seriola dumerili TaxID=41447 RepID=A0A3B4UY39_SERDU
IRPISNTVDIFVTGLDAASLSFLASNFGLKSSTGSRNANEGISFTSSFISSVFSSSLLFTSHILPGLLSAFSSPISGNLGSSCSTTMCFLSRDQPLGLSFTPFGFCMTLRRGSAAGRDLSPSFFSSTDLTAGAAELGFTPSALVLVAVTGFTGSFGSCFCVFGLLYPGDVVIKVTAGFVGSDVGVLGL